MRCLKIFRPLLCFIAGLALNLNAQTSTPAPDLDNLFQRTNGWVGADAAYSIPLFTNKTLWLFGDTWVGEINNGARTNVVMINNSIALQSSLNIPEFFYRTNKGHKAQSFFPSPDGKTFFWPMHGARTKAGLFVFLHQVKTISKSAFGFRVVGVWIARIKNPDDPPLRWKIETKKTPFAHFQDREMIGFGSAILQHDRFLYAYGTSSKGDRSKHGQIVARVPQDKVFDFGAWRFFCNGEWKKEFRDVTAIWHGGASEISVSWQPTLNKFLAIHTEGIHGRIVMRTADSPVGPWSEAKEIYRCPEMQISKTIFCYAGKGHPELSAADELVITYAANSLSLTEVVNDARLYWPRFVRLKFNR